MTEEQWQIFCKFKEEFKSKVEEWKLAAPELTDLQRQAALDAKTPEYPFETSVVYNRDLDKFTKDDEIRLIVIGDNPGKDEQLAKNNRYLVGQAGKIADGFFKKNAELGVDFRKNVIILNKTPVHSAKTIQLKKMMQLGGAKIERLILESQVWMAEKTAEFYVDFFKAADSQKTVTYPELWLVGYSELKDKGFFTSYRDKLKESICKSGRETDREKNSAWDSVYVFQHFSMNRFTIDLREQTEHFITENVNEGQSGAGQAAQIPVNSLLQKIHFTGKKHKEEIFGL